MDTLKSLVQPLMGNSSVVDGMKFVVIGGAVETVRRVSSSGWNHFVNSFFLTAHFCEEEQPYDWLVLWLSRRPEWQRSREFEATLRAFSTASTASSTKSPADLEWEEAEREWETYNSSLSSSGAPPPLPNDRYVRTASTDADTSSSSPLPEKPKSRIIFQPTYDTTHTIFFRNHMLRIKRQRKLDTGSEAISISVIARSNSILKQLVLQAKKEYEAECVHRIQIYFADAHGSWRWTDSRAKRPLSSIVLNPGVKEMLVDDTRDFLNSEKWYMDRGIPFRRGYLLYGVPGSGKSSLIHALAGYLQLDIYVVSLSASWISDSTLTSLMGRVPARCVVLLEDLDAAFTRSTSRSEDEEEQLLASLNGKGNNGSNDDGNNLFGNGNNNHNSSSSRRSRHRSSSSRQWNNDNAQYLSEVNTLSLSGLLNALDGVTAAEGRLLFATTNHLEKLDPALSRPGRMDVWIEFKNASRWQAEGVFKNFFPCEEEQEKTEDGAEGVRNNANAQDRPSERDLQEIEEVMKSIKVDCVAASPSSSSSSIPSSPMMNDSRRASRIFTPSTPMTSLSSSVPPTPIHGHRPGHTASASTGSLWSLFSSSASASPAGGPNADDGGDIVLSPSTSSSASGASSPLSIPVVGLPHGQGQGHGHRGGESMSGSFTMPTVPVCGYGGGEVSARGLAREEEDGSGVQRIVAVGGAGGAEGSGVKRNVKARLDRRTLNELAKQFADGIPEEEFSVAALQGYLLKHKTNPHLAASGIGAWVASERTLRLTLAAEKAAREAALAAKRTERLAELREKKREKEEKEEKEREKEKIKNMLKEREEEEEVEKLRERLREKEREREVGKVKEVGGDKKEGERTSEEAEDEDKENWCDALSG